MNTHEINPKDIESFWQTIDKSNTQKNVSWDEYDVDKQLEKLTEILTNWDKKQLVQFERILQYTLYQLETKSIAELSII